MIEIAQQAAVFVALVTGMIGIGYVATRFGPKSGEPDGNMISRSDVSDDSGDAN